MDEQLKSNLTSSKHWLRLLYMVLFALILHVATFVMAALVVVQFLFALITGNDNKQLRSFGDSLSIFMFDTLQFLIYNSENKPFPFADWPESSVDVESDRSDEKSNEQAESETPAKKPATKRKASPKKKAASKKVEAESSSETTDQEKDENAKSE